MFKKVKMLLKQIGCSCYNEKKYEKRGICMYKALDVARYIINYANDNNIIISNLKLQKILYFVQLEFLLRNKNQPCFSDAIEAWDFGPVVPCVYHEFKIYGAFPIPKISYVYNMGSNFLNIKREDYSSTISIKDKSVIEDVVNECDRFSASQLVDITHNQTPWKRAYAFGKNSVISVDWLRDFVDSL